jgi:hypothetical protein
VPSTDEVIDAEKEKLRTAIRHELAAEQATGEQARPMSSEYQTFKKQYLPKHYSFYEKACHASEFLSIKPDAKESARYQEAIEKCHLNVTPTGAFSFALLVTLGTILFGAFVSIVLPIVFFAEPSFFFLLTFAIIGMALFIPLKNLPFTLAASWRLRASNQMVLCMFYVTTYMRQNSNLERAIDFAAEHIGPPLSLDLKKLIWEVQTEQASSLSEALDRYLVEWKESNLEFVESMNLVQASTFETTQERRLRSLEKAMDIMLEETYEKMLHYAQNLKSPMTMLHMLGIILPILGLVILPLAVSFVEGVTWYHIAVLYNLLLPAIVFYLGFTILADRPTGYGSADVTEINPALKKFQNHIIRKNGSERIVKASTEAWTIGIVLVLIGLLPLFIHLAAPSFDIPEPLGEGKPAGAYQLLGYRLNSGGQEVGPFGLGAAVLSLFVVLGAGLGLAHYYKVRTRELIRIRDETKQLEQEFAGALFQLGNRLGDGIPVELAFSRVAEVMEGTKSGEFFRACAINVQKMGMSPERAIFDPKRGAILLYPSPLIESSMKVLIESSKKGPAEASLALVNMSNYVKEIHRVDERLKDLMADIISGMKSQISFLTPAIAGIVIGITSMITTILGQLQDKFSEIGTASGAGSDAAGIGGLTDLLGLGLPTYHFQFIVGLYVVQITWILAYLVNGIENGEDKLNREHEQALGLLKATSLYCGIALVVMLVFNVIAGSIMGGAI